MCIWTLLIVHVAAFLLRIACTTYQLDSTKLGLQAGQTSMYHQHFNQPPQWQGTHTSIYSSRPSLPLVPNLVGAQGTPVRPIDSSQPCPPPVPDTVCAQDVKLDVAFAPSEINPDVRVERVRMRVEGGEDRCVNL